MTRLLLSILAAFFVTTAAANAFACNYDTVVSVGALPTCFDVFGGCGELTLESTCAAPVTFEEVDCSNCGPTQTLQNGDFITYPLSLPPAVEGSTTEQAFRWESEGTQAFVDVTTTYTTTGDVACAASTAHRGTPMTGGFAAVALIGFALFLRRRR